MRILAIETSCDETSISILEARGGFESPNFNILANVVSSQASLHAQYGGVFPNLAKREHLKNLPLVLEESIRTANLNREASDVSHVDIIAVTYGPGLEPALWTGIEFAKNLAQEWKKPLVAVNHMEGHIASVLLNGGTSPTSLKELHGASNDQSSIFKTNLEANQANAPKKLSFPAVALLVSGGHTEIVLIKKWLDYEIIGETRDDAAGECFDKGARMLGLGYPGGPVISAEAEKARNPKHEIQKKSGNSKIVSNSEFSALDLTLPRPMLHSKDYDFSFSGLKTALLYLIRDIRKETGKEDISDLVPELAHEFQNAVVETLVAKTIRAVIEHNTKSLILAGGVANNKLLQNVLAKAASKSSPHTTLHIPQTLFTTDNGAMIGAAGYLRALNKDYVQNLDSLSAKGHLRLGGK